MNPIIHPIKLKQGSVKFLRDMVSGTGWAKTIPDIIVGGELLSKVIPDINEPPQRQKDQTNEQHKVTTKEWSDTEVPDFGVTEKQREAVKKAIKFFADQGAIPPTQYAAELLVAFGLSE